MTASKTKSKNGEKVIKPANKVYMVLITCPSHGQGIDDVDLTEGFRTPARVIEVLEKPVDEANRVLEKLEDEGGLQAVLAEAMGVDAKPADEVTESGFEEEVVEEDVNELGDIFPEEEDSGTEEKSGDIDFMDALNKLDEEDDMSGLDDLGPEGLPEL